VTRIDIYPAGEELDQQAIRVTHGVSRMITICEVLTKSKSIPCSRGEVLAPSDTRSGHHPSASFSPQQTTSKQVVRFSEVVTGLLGLLSPIKPDMRPIQIKACHWGQNNRSLIDTDEGYHTETSE
jgi:hypothetical protein